MKKCPVRDKIYLFGGIFLFAYNSIMNFCYMRYTCEKERTLCAFQNLKREKAKNCTCEDVMESNGIGWVWEKVKKLTNGRQEVERYGTKESKWLPGIKFEKKEKDRDRYLCKKDKIYVNYVKQTKNCIRWKTVICAWWRIKQK